jgi:hypothetical protein
VQYAVTSSTLQGEIPNSLLSQVLVGNWQIGESGSEEFQVAILDAKMRGFRAVFIIFLPLMVLCMVGSLFVDDVVLNGDKKNEVDGGALNVPLTTIEEKRG